MRADRERYALPPRLFLYTQDQIAELLQVNVKDVPKWLHLDGVTPGRRRRGMMLAKNIAPHLPSPEWRIEERDFIIWMKETGIIPHAR